MRDTYYQRLEERKYPTPHFGAISRRLFYLQHCVSIARDLVQRSFVSKKRLASSQLYTTSTPSQAN